MPAALLLKCSARGEKGNLETKQTFAPHHILTEEFTAFRLGQHERLKFLNDRLCGMKHCTQHVSAGDGGFSPSSQMKAVQANAGETILGISQNNHSWLYYFPPGSFSVFSVVDLQ